MNHGHSFFKINIVHQDSVSGLHAAGVLQRLAARLGARLGRDINPWQICTHVWKFEWLQNPELWADAVTRAAEADMIIIAPGGHMELPACVRCWIESVLPRKRDGLAALVALLDRQETRSLPPARYLRQLARQYGVKFISNLDDRPSQTEASIEAVFLQLENGLNFSGATVGRSPQLRTTARQPRRDPSTASDLCSTRSPSS